MSKSANKGEYIIFRASPYDKELIISKARRANTSVSDFCRKAALGKEVKYIEGLEKTNYDLGKVGNNLNQLAAAANQGRNVAGLIPEALSRLSKTLDNIDTVLGTGGDEYSNSQTD